MYTKEELKAKRIGVLLGGMSSEREVSLLSGGAVLKALRELGYDAVGVEADEILPQRLRELGVEILAAGTQNSTLEDFYRMKALMHKDARIIDDTSTAGLLGVMKEKMPDLIVAGGKTKFLALKTKTPFLDINHGRSHPYAGYEGMVTFARQLDLTVNNPIWPLLNSPGDRAMSRMDFTG